MAAGKSSRINRQYKTKYRIRNWREYECGLRSRGDVTIWNCGNDWAIGSTISEWRDCCGGTAGE